LWLAVGFHFLSIPASKFGKIFRRVGVAAMDYGMDAMKVREGSPKCRQTGTRLCSKCRKTGHNARTCLEAEEIANLSIPNDNN
jgi:hypothetical protein